jgi:hypothetical protein
MTGTVNDGDPALTLNATDVTVYNADGSTTQTITDTIAQVTSNSTSVKDKTVIATSDDGLTKTTQLDINNDGTVERTELRWPQPVAHPRQQRRRRQRSFRDGCHEQ